MPPTLPPQARRQYRRPQIPTILILVLLMSGAAFAQVCEPELRAAVRTERTLKENATALARVVVESVEPALPRGREAHAALTDPDARWLYERRFLPGGWSDSEPLTAQEWEALLNTLQAPYKVEPRALSGNIDVETLVAEAGQTLEDISDALRPLALIATSRGNRSKVELAGVTWNWTPWPRLLLFNPESLEDAQGDIDQVLTHLGTCAWHPKAYVSTNANTASNYYLGSSDATATILATDLSPTGSVVPKELEEAVLTFQAEQLAGASVAAIGFEGSGPSVGQLTSLLFSAKTSVGLFDLFYYLALP